MGSLAGWGYRYARSAHAHFVWALWTSGELIVKAAWPGGDKTVNHNRVRDNTYAQAKRSHVAPQLEVSGVCGLMGLQENGDTRQRPADVLLCRAQDIRTGVGSGSGRVALDIGIICPQAACHSDAASREALGAAEEYVTTKCARGDVERRCREAGIVFQPLIFESLGGGGFEGGRQGPKMFEQGGCS